MGIREKKNTEIVRRYVCLVDSDDAEEMLCADLSDEVTKRIDEVIEMEYDVSWWVFKNWIGDKMKVSDRSKELRKSLVSATVDTVNKYLIERQLNQLEAEITAALQEAKLDGVDWMIKTILLDN